jgi:hypothetical protein
MNISELERVDLHDTTRIQARIIWETTPQPDQHIFMDAPRHADAGLWPDPNAFLLAAYIPAWQAGETRVQVEGALCPWLCDNMQVALAVLRHWTALDDPPTIDATHGFHARHPQPPFAASFLSCGVDSMATLYTNNTLLPPDHPGAIRAVIPIDYLWKHPNRTREEEAWRAKKRNRMAATVAADLDIDVIPLRTNILDLNPDGVFFFRRWTGAVLSAIGHALSQRFNQVYVASSNTIKGSLLFDGERATQQRPIGTHQLIDPFFSSAHLQVIHHGIQMNRIEKVKRFANWPVGLQNLFVCEGRVSGENNCGRCEKCIQTMMVLAALGKLKDSAFPIDDVTPDLVATLDEYDMIKLNMSIYYYQEFIPFLQASGRPDLAQALTRVIEAWHTKHSKEIK